MFQLAIVIPCYNEESRLDENLFIQFANKHTNILLAFVDDGSTDSTLMILRSIQVQAKNNIEVITQKKNRGKGTAISTGLQYIIREATTPYLGYLDADLSTPLEELNSMLQHLKQKQFDFILGSRIKKLGNNIERHYFRHFSGRLIATAVDEVFKLGCYDTQCGAKLFKTSILEDVVKEPFVTRWLFDVELLLRIRNKYKILNGFEYPLSNWRHVQNSKITLFSFPMIIKELLTLFIKYRHCS